MQKKMFPFVWRLLPNMRDPANAHWLSRTMLKIDENSFKLINTIPSDDPSGIATIAKGRRSPNDFPASL
jgi:hypothetical protein